jgi:hypothetical protein
LFFAVVRFSPPSQETEAAKRKAQVKNNSPDSHEPTFTFWLRLSEAKPRHALYAIPESSLLPDSTYCHLSFRF